MMTFVQTKITTSFQLINRINNKSQNLIVFQKNGEKV